MDSRTVGLYVAVGCCLTQLTFAQALAQRVQTAEELKRRIHATEQSIEEGVQTEAALSRLLTERADAFTKLIENDPAEALRTQLPETLASSIRRVSAQLGTLLERQGTWTGSLNVYIEDNFERKTSRKIFRLLADGSESELYFPDAAPKSTCESISVHGVGLGSKIAVASIERVAAASTPCGTIGIQNVAVIYARFPGTPFAPDATLALVQNAFFGSNTRSLSDFWSENSLGLTSASGTVVGPITLDDDYLSCDSGLIERAAIRAADSLLDFRNFQRIFVVTPARPGCDIGIGQIGCGTYLSASHRLYTASSTLVTIGANQAPNSFVDVIAHEGGHNLGLDHASSLDYGSIPLGPLNVPGIHAEYGDLFSGMGVSYTYNGTTLVGHYAAPHKSMLHWLKIGSSIQQVENNGTYVVAPYESNTPGVKALRIRRGPGNNLWLWIEYRQAVGNYDPTLSPVSGNIFQGALIHYEDPTYLPDQTHLLDFHPSATPNTFSDAPLDIGSTWNDPYSPTRIRIIGSSTAGLVVSVGYDSATCAYSISQGSPLSGEGGEGTVVVNTSANCGWNAFSTTNWLSIASGGIGTGAGIINLSASPNTTGATRSANIVIGGQSFAVAQSAAQIGSSVSPTSGSGSSQAFTFTYTDAGGFQNIAGYQIVINSTLTGVNSCYILVGRGTNTISLADDAGNPGPTNSVGFPGVLQNSQCSVLSSVSSQSGSGNAVTLMLTVVFKPGFAGPKNVYSSFNTVAGVSSGFQQVGTFTATVNVQPIAVTSVVPSAGTGSAQSFTFNNLDPNGFEDLAGTRVVFNTGLGGVNACYILFARGTNRVTLADDSGNPNNPLSTAPLGSQTVLNNSQCSVFLANSYQSGSGTNLSVTFFIAFKPSFAGTKSIFSETNDNAGNRSVFAQVGSWTVPSTPPVLLAVNVTPASATGPSQALRFVFADPNGFTDISGEGVVVNPTVTGVNSCYIQVARGTGQINLADDAGNNTIPSATLGQSTVLQNSQCIVNVAASYQSGSGNYLDLTLFITMKTAGMKNVYAQANSNGGATSPFSQVGTWNVTAPSTMRPVAVAPTPGAGAAGTSQLFTFTYSNPAGANDISGTLIVFSPSLQGVGACYVLFGRGNSLVSLASDNATTFTSGTLGSATVLQNSQCSVDVSKSFAVQTGNTLDLSLAVTFKAGFKALVYMFSDVQNNAGLDSGYAVLGSHQVQ